MPSLKMGVMEDDVNRSRLVKLLQVKTSKLNGEYISFTDYVERMKENQKDIYYIPRLRKKSRRVHLWISF